ncbi:MAG TPA: alpha/beta fold hydrolase [Anaeromyxobacter sp.]|nr:alpha/beta fold hydrolase [Anaeromyxobacter sp.]
MPTLELKSGARLAYTDQGGGLPLLLVHGWSASAAVFDGLSAQLAPGRRIVSLDLRGHGGSEAGVPFALPDLAEDLATVAERLDLRGAVLLGWSLGGQVALAALPALRSRLVGLALLSTTPRFTLGEGWPHGLPASVVEALAHRVRRDAPRAMARFFEGCFAPGELDPAGRERADALRNAIPTPAAPAALAGLAILAGTDLRGRLGEIALPTVVIHGEEDPICPAGAGRALAAAIPGARLALLAGLGHAPLVSRPAAVAGALRPLLEAAG